MGGRVVFPTPVGVFLQRAVDIPTWLGLPHARGGVSFWRDSDLNALLSSPRPWGCF